MHYNHPLFQWKLLLIRSICARSIDYRETVNIFKLLDNTRTLVSSLTFWISQLTIRPVIESGCRGRIGNRENQVSSEWQFAPKFEYLRGWSNELMNGFPKRLWTLFFTIYLTFVFQYYYPYTPINIVCLLSNPWYHFLSFSFTPFHSTIPRCADKS